MTLYVNPYSKKITHGTPPEHLPMVEDFRDKSRHATNVETQIERGHAQLHRWVASAPHHSECFASVSMRREDVITGVESSDASAWAFAEELDTVRSPAKCIEKLGLSAHPSLQDLVDEDGLSENLPHYLANRIIYHSDLRIIFMDLPDLCDPEESGDPGREACCKYSAA